MQHFLSFLQEFTKNPSEIGSIMPSSRALAQAITAGLDWPSMNTVVELGPGTGSFSRLISEQLSQSGRYLALEPNARFRDILATQIKGIELAPEYAHDLLKLIPEQSAELIICGLPFSLFEWQSVETTVNAIFDALTDDGVFRCFCYSHTRPLPKVRRFIELLQEKFDFTTSYSVMMNLPPATIIHCHKKEALRVSMELQA